MNATWDRVLNQPRLSGGIGVKAMGLVWGPCAGVGMLMLFDQSELLGLGILAAGALLHGVLAWLYAKDDQFFEVYAFYGSIAERYCPMPGPGFVSFDRPHGWGQHARF